MKRRGQNQRQRTLNLQHEFAFTLRLCAILPTTHRNRMLITHGDRQLPIAYDFDDVGFAARYPRRPMPHTPLEEGIRQTLELFRRLHAEGRLDLADLESRLE